jgi:HlyD family secretion protein
MSIESKTRSAIARGSLAFGLFFMGLLVGIAVVAAIVFRNPPRDEQLAKIVVKPEIPPTVSAWGRLAPQSDVIPLSAAANQFVACVEELMVAEGDAIMVGQAIAVLDSNLRRQAVVDEAKARVASAQAKLAMAQVGAKPEEIAVQSAMIEANQAEFEEAKQQYERGASLVASQSISQEDQAARLTRWKKASASLNQTRSQLDSLKNPRAEDIAFAKAEVALAESSLVVAQADLEQSIIRSPIEGKVLQVHARQGEKIGEKGVVDIGDTRIMHAIAEVYEEDIGRVQVGQSAEIFIPSLHRRLGGTVQRISQIVARKSVFSNDPVEDTDARVIEVRIALEPEGSGLVSGLSNARIHARIDAPPIQSDSRSGRLSGSASSEMENGEFDRFKEPSP